MEPASPGTNTGTTHIERYLVPDTMVVQTCRLLHVEDTLDDAELIEASLARSGMAFSLHRVDTEEGYRAALQTRQFDAILCDYRLPRFSAEHALRILGEHDRAIPFIIVSHHIGETAAVIAMQNGASDYLTKGDLGRLAKAISGAIDRNRARAEKQMALDALRRNEALTRSILDSLSARIAVLDGDGRILAVNRPWLTEDGGGQSVTGVVGDNYLQALERAAAGGNQVAADGLAAIRCVMAREKLSVSLDYSQCGDARRWFLGRVMALQHSQAGVVISHQDITDRVLAHLALDDANRRLQVLSKRLLQVQEDERRAISRELHDDFGQSLTALKIGLHRVARDAQEPQRALLGEALGVADTTLEKIRALALKLRPPQLDQLGLVEAIEALVQRQQIATGLSIRCAVDGLARAGMCAEQETACYRIVQEALSNACRHAHASRIEIAGEVGANLVRVSIHDNGHGFDVGGMNESSLKSGSMGLISMEERAQLAGGRLRVRSVHGGGTTVTVTFPLSAAIAGAAG